MVPDKIDLQKFLDLDSSALAELSVPLYEIHFLVIDDALNNIRNEDLFGDVLLE
ncbi:hypothetical protein [Sphingobacterium litopenaei]|uniref:hypothetical protein n=1 Tax=Sphingobacterium litopenaei TaxID=2763500 RepID=UPI00168112D5|nr:hypothetical protein [Sphingobacterium litopenaei]